MFTKPKIFAAELITELESLPELKTARMRQVRRQYSKKLRSADSDFVFAVAQAVLNSERYDWIAYELIRDHPPAYQSLDRKNLESLGRGIDSWSSVDSFSRILSGPAWRDGLISIDTIRHWANSADRWWRRAALVSTVALNVRSHGGKGDVSKTLAICEMLVQDHDDMVVKALSWALRELVVHGPEAVEKFISTHQDLLAPRVKREVRNKLKTGLKNP